MASVVAQFSRPPPPRFARERDAAAAGVSASPPLPAALPLPAAATPEPLLRRAEHDAAAAEAALVLALGERNARELELDALRAVLLESQRALRGQETERARKLQAAQGVARALRAEQQTLQTALLDAEARALRAERLATTLQSDVEALALQLQLHLQGQRDTEPAAATAALSPAPATVEPSEARQPDDDDDAAVALAELELQLAAARDAAEEAAATCARLQAERDEQQELSRALRAELHELRKEQQQRREEAAAAAAVEEEQREEEEGHSASDDLQTELMHAMQLASDDEAEEEVEEVEVDDLSDSPADPPQQAVPTLPPARAIVAASARVTPSLLRWHSTTTLLSDVSLGLVLALLFLSLIAQRQPPPLFPT